VILGRPRIFRDEDCDQSLDRINDANLAATGAEARSTYNQCVSDGPVFHAKFVNHLLVFLIITRPLVVVQHRRNKLKKS
jgi:hypothetical protein